MGFMMDDASKSERYEMQEPDFSSSRVFAVVEKLSVITFVCCISALLYYICYSFWSVRLPVYMFLGFFVGALLADSFSGLLHWLGDTYGSPVGGLFSLSFVAPFRWYHVKPTAMVEYSLWVNLGTSCLIADIAMGVLYFFMFQWPEFTLVVLFWFLLVGTFTNLCHRLSHSIQRNWLVRFLQKSRLILSSKHHCQHHIPPFQKRYCISNGWANYVFDAIGLWRKLEFILKCFGLRPHPSCKVMPRVVSSSIESKKKYKQQRRGV
jgi:plasmanylethanolamine desaturase